VSSDSIQRDGECHGCGEEKQRNSDEYQVVHGVKDVPLQNGGLSEPFRLDQRVKQIDENACHQYACHPDHWSPICNGVVHATNYRFCRIKMA
jgi:hypothetical protein